MITSIEAAVAQTVRAALGEDAALAGIAYVVHAATSRATVPGDRSVVAVRVTQAPRTLVMLADYELEIIVGTPAVSEDTSVAAHEALEQALEKVWAPGREITIAEDTTQTVEDYLSAQIASRMAGWSGAGFFNRGWQPGREETSWIPALALLVGAVKVGA